MKNLHLLATSLTRTILGAEAELVELFQKIDRIKGYRELDYPSLFAYATRGLKLSESYAYHLIAVSRKSSEVPALLEALKRGTITIAKAKSICSVITPENAEQWIAAAESYSTRELERAVARDSTKKKVPLSLETLALLERVRELAAQKTSAPADLEQAIVAAAKAYLDKNDPMEKAIHVESKRKAFRRNGGACQFTLPDGKICGARQWIHVHHRKARARGGGDEPDNLITLCASHHRIMHGK